MITIITNSKGGEGKTTIATIIPILSNNSNFEIIEIDNNNKSNLTFENSELLKDKLTTLKVKEAEDYLDNVFYEALQDKEKHTIIVSGGGDDAKKLLEFVADQPGQDIIKYIIPLTPAGDLSNILDTYNLIPNKENVLFCLNGYHDKENIKNEFFNFFGDRKLGFKGVIDSVKNANILTIPFSKFFAISKRFRLSIIDLANYSNDLNRDEAYELFNKKSKGDAAEYAKMYKKYRASLAASKVVAEIKDNLKSM